MHSLVAIAVGLLLIVVGFLVIWLLGKLFEAIYFDNIGDDPAMTILHGLAGTVMIVSLSAIAWKLGTIILQVVHF